MTGVLWAIRSCAASDLAAIVVLDACSLSIMPSRCNVNPSTSLDFNLHPKSVPNLDLHSAFSVI